MGCHVILWRPFWLAGFRESESGAHRIADDGERNPGSQKEAVAIQEAGAVLKGEEGSGELVHGAALLAETVACRQAEDPDTDDGEEHKACDPDVGGHMVLLDACDQRADERRDGDGEEGCQELWGGGVRIGMGGGHHDEDGGQGEDRDEGVEGEPGGFAHEVAGGFILRQIEFLGGCGAHGPSCLPRKSGKCFQLSVQEIGCVRKYGGGDRNGAPESRMERCFLMESTYR
jgi:hypothetical protein